MYLMKRGPLIRLLQDATLFYTSITFCGWLFLALLTPPNFLLCVCMLTCACAHFLLYSWVLQSHWCLHQSKYSAHDQHTKAIRETRQTIWLRLAVKWYQFSGSNQHQPFSVTGPCQQWESCCSSTEQTSPFPLCKKSLPSLQLPDGSDSQGSDLPLLPRCTYWSVSPQSTELQLNLSSRTTSCYRSWGKQNIEAS